MDNLHRVTYSGLIVKYSILACAWRRHADGNDARWVGHRQGVDSETETVYLRGAGGWFARKSHPVVQLPEKMFLARKNWGKRIAEAWVVQRGALSAL